MNKSIRGKQAQLHNGWFKKDGIQFEQPMNYNEIDGQYIPKGIKKVLEEKNFWSSSRRNLEYLKFR